MILIFKSFQSIKSRMLQDYENDALVHLKRILANKWDFVVMQAEEQVQQQQIFIWFTIQINLHHWSLIAANYSTH